MKAKDFHIDQRVLILEGHQSDKPVTGTVVAISGILLEIRRDDGVKGGGAKDAWVNYAELDGRPYVELL